jgi:hypothetical protein
MAFLLGLGCSSGAALAALGEDSGVEAFPQSIWELINFVAAIDLDGLASGVVGDDAMITFAEVLLKVGAHGSRDLFVEQVV